MVRNIGDYARFFDTFASVSGQWVNYSELADDAEVSKETIRRYVTLLEDTLVAFHLPAWRNREAPTRKNAQRDK